MERRLFITDDGSPSFIIPGKNLTYHSRFGALQESMHVFINAGLKQLSGKFEILNVFEMGFGTGLNAFLTAKYANQYHHKVHYTGIELFPLNSLEMKQLTACSFFNEDADKELMTAINESVWENEVIVNEFFTVSKRKADLLQFIFDEPVHLVFFDAFDPAEQPELWTTEIFKKIYNAMVTDGVFVTYSCKGQVRRNLQEAGFVVEKIPGPPGKREIIRAFKK